MTKLCKLNLTFSFQVLTEAKDHARIIMLNRPRQLNALSHEMVPTEAKYVMKIM